MGSHCSKFELKMTQAEKKHTESTVSVSLESTEITLIKENQTTQAFFYRPCLLST